jgi:hypothetical protein
MRAGPRAMPVGLAARDFSFRKRYDNADSSVSMAYGLIYHAPMGLGLFYTGSPVVCTTG